MLIARMNSIRIVLWGLGLMPFDTINRTCSFFRKSARRIETNYRTCVSQLFPRKISFCDRINKLLPFEQIDPRSKGFERSNYLSSRDPTLENGSRKNSIVATPLQV